MEENQVNQEVKEEGIKTEVTSLAKEEEKTGQKVELPSEDELVKKASVSLIQSRRQLQALLANMSKKQIMRAVTASTDLPAEDMPVFLKTPEEKQFFAVSQRAFADKFLILQHHINKEMRKRQEEQLQKLKEQQLQVPTTEEPKVETTNTINQEGEVK